MKLSASETARARWGLLFASALTASSYAPSWSVPYAGDDLLFIAAATPDRPWHYLLNANPFHEMYRPLTSALISYSIAIAGLAPWPVHLANISVHVLLCLLVGHVVRRLGFAPLQATLAALYMGVAQATTITISSNDGFQQIAVTLFGSASLWLLWRGLTAQRTLRLVGAVGLFTAALLAKESGIAYLAAAGLMCVLAATRAASNRYWRAAITWLAMLTIAVAWLFWRGHLGLAQPNWKGSTGYSFQSGFGILRNVAIMGAATVVPFSSSDTFLAVVNRHWLFVAVVGAATTAVALMVARGLVRVSRVLVAAFLVLGVVLMFPHAFMIHVSEMYVYSPLPFVAALAGIAFGAPDVQRTVRSRVAWVSAVALVFAINIHAVISQTRQLRAVAEDAERVTEEILPMLRAAPSGTVVLLANEPRGPEYSVFVAHGFTMLQNVEKVLPHLAGRPDVEVKLVEIAEIGTNPCPSVVVVQRFGQVQTLREAVCKD